MKNRSSLGWVVAALVLGGCGEGGGSTIATNPAGTPNVIDAPAPPGTERGRTVAAQAGCLACHMFGDSGNDGPGPDLTHVGARLDRAAIRRSLLEPERPMPSYESLPRDDLDALVEYLAALR